MPDIAVTVRDRNAAVNGSPVIVCGNSSYVLRFDFDREWNLFPEKNAVFQFCRNGSAECMTVPFRGDACPVPVLRGVCAVRVGVTAGTIRTASPAVIPCACCITDAPATPAPEPADCYQMLTEQLNRIIQPKQTRRCILCDAEGFVIRDRTGAVITVKG